MRTSCIPVLCVLINDDDDDDEDGVTATGTRPNRDGTFQMRKTLEILECQGHYDML